MLFLDLHVAADAEQECTPSQPQRDGRTDRVNGGTDAKTSTITLGFVMLQRSMVRLLIEVAEGFDDPIEWAAAKEKQQLKCCKFYSVVTPAWHSVHYIRLRIH